MKTLGLAFVLVALAAGCSKKAEDKPKEQAPARNVPSRDFSPGPLAGSDGERPERVRPPDRMQPPDRGDQQGRGGGGTWNDRRAEYDTDGDGQLSDEERETMKEARRAERDARREEMVAKYDADGDGQLSDAERAVMKTERVQGMVDRLDGDGDGKLTQAELEDGRGGGRRGRRGPPIDFATADTDHDGSLSADELGAAMPDRGPGGFRREPDPAGDVE